MWALHHSICSWWANVGKVYIIFTTPCVFGINKVQNGEQEKQTWKFLYCLIPLQLQNSEVITALGPFFFHQLSPGLISSDINMYITHPKYEFSLERSHSTPYKQKNVGYKKYCTAWACLLNVQARNWQRNSVQNDRTKLSCECWNW